MMWFSAWIAKSKELKGCEGVVGEDGGPAEEEDRHDQDQHVDHLVKIINLILKQDKKKTKWGATFLVSASLLKVRGAAIIWKKRKIDFSSKSSFVQRYVYEWVSESQKLYSKQASISEAELNMCKWRNSSQDS